MSVIEKIKSQRLFFDGGMGSLLQSSGLTPGEAPEKWNITHPDVICDIHSRYIASGCDILTSNTFGVNTLKYTADDAEKIIRAAFDCMDKAICSSGRKIYKALDIGPLGKLLEPYGDLPFERAVEIFAETARVGALCGADVVLIETMNDSYETRAAVIAAKENCDLPIFVTNVYDSTHKLMTGADVPAMIAMLEGLRVDAIGMNCSLGPRQMMEILPSFLEYSSTPIIVQPNAGLPVSRDGKTVYDVTPEEFSELMAEMARMGATVLGGCCGTTPEYIKLTVEKVKDISFSPVEKKEKTLVSSYTHATEIGCSPVLIGERINPTGKPKLKEALRQNNMSFILSEALGQSDRGAHILDVNVGLPEIDEVEKMCEAVKGIQAVCDLPLQIDTSNPIAMERAVRIYNGKPLINSVNGKAESMSAIFPIVKKYGGTVIALTLDENGIPETALGRFEIAKKILCEAQKYGIEKKDIVVDPLALTVSSNPESANVTLESIRMIKEGLGLHTSLGISNISFGLPMRDFITATFYSMALCAGLDCAIMNVYSPEVMKVYHTYLALRGGDERFEKYIEFASSVSSVSEQGTPVSVKRISGEGELQNAIIKGLKDKARDECKALLENISPMDVINHHIIPALDSVGRAFEEKTLYLPQLLMSAEASQCAFEVVKEKIPRGEMSGEKIVLATVKGDIHDIGKNIVKVLLENFGFDVIDLGRDVPPEKIVRTAMAQRVKLVGLSALMTTTVPSMQETIRLLKKEDENIKVMVGGAVLTQTYADMIGADYYSPDAMGSVRYAQQLLK